MLLAALLVLALIAVVGLLIYAQRLQVALQQESASARAWEVRAASMTAAYEAEKRARAEGDLSQSALMEDMERRFKVLAQDVLEEKGQRFTDQSQEQLSRLLDPLREGLTHFSKKVEDAYGHEGRERASLAEQIRQLLDLNSKLSHEAHNLTKALKGDSKVRGNWGEVILERVLENSGLRKGHEYHVQESHLRTDGTRAQPDVVVLLPEKRHLMVDSKVSLVAFEEYISSEDELVREQALRRHCSSLRQHVKELSAKEYHKLKDSGNADFCLLFVPVEPAFLAAISQDPELWQDAWKLNVLLVSPSTLLFVLRTVAQLWRQESQSRNAQDIARRGADLYDKFVAFVSDMDDVGKRLEQAQVSHHNALKKLSQGRGNLVAQAQKLVDLGVKPSKQLAPEWNERAAESLESL
jgi:DNA recombination protein RmuC